MKTENFWAEQFPYPKNIPVCAEVPEQVDVAVVGGGFTGLNAALVLAQSGARGGAGAKHIRVGGKFAQWRHVDARPQGTVELDP